MPSRPALAVALLLVIAGLGTVWIQARSSAGIDFYQMWIGARMAREAENFYSPETRAVMGELYLRQAVADGASPRQVAVAQHRRNLEVLSTPLLYTLYVFLQTDYERALLLFQLIVFAALAGWVVIFGRLFGFDNLLILLVLAVLLLAFEPVRSDAAVANMNHIMLLLLALAGLQTARKRFALAGAILAIATLTKPYVILTFAVTYLFWIAARRWRDLAQHAAGAAAATVVALIASSAWFGSATIWLEWLRAFRAIPSSMIPIDLGNFALAALTRPMSIVVFAAAVVALAVAAFRAKPGASFDVAAIALGCVLFQFVSPLVWAHHLLLSVPLMLWLLRPAASRPRQIAGAVGLALIAVEPWGTFVPTVTWVALGVNAGLAVAFVAGASGLWASPTPAAR